MSRQSKREIELETLLDKYSYLSIITSMLSNLITAENLPEELEEDFDYFLINCLLNRSEVGIIVKDSEGFHYTFGNLVEPWDDFGYGKRFITFTRMGKEYKGELNKDGCRVFPFSSRRPINVVIQNAEHLAELNKSQKFLIGWAKVAPVLVCKDSRSKQALTELIQSVMQGNMIPTLSGNTIQDLLDGNTETLSKLDFFEADRIRDLQYLDEHKDHVVKEMFNLFGMPYTTSSKMAQQNNAEIEGSNGACYVFAMDILKNFKKFEKNLNKTFNLNIKFNLNPLILAELEKYYNEEEENREVGENIQDEIATASHDTNTGTDGDSTDTETDRSGDSEPDKQ